MRLHSQVDICASRGSLYDEGDGNLEFDISDTGQGVVERKERRRPMTPMTSSAKKRERRRDGRLPVALPTSKQETETSRFYCTPRKQVQSLSHEVHLSLIRRLEPESMGFDVL